MTTFYDEVLVHREHQKLVKGIRSFLDHYRLDREDFKETPERVARMWQTFWHAPIPSELKHFPTLSYGDIICIKDYTTWSFCPHHLLPVKYVLKIGYIPDKRALGLSKLGRATQTVMKILPLQEDVGHYVADLINEAVTPKGIGVVVHGEHLCMQMRGISDPCVCASSDHFRGKMLEEHYQRRFLNL